MWSVWTMGVSPKRAMSRVEMGRMGEAPLEMEGLC